MKFKVFVDQNGKGNWKLDSVIEAKSEAAAWKAFRQAVHGTWKSIRDPRIEYDNPADAPQADPVQVLNAVEGMARLEEYHRLTNPEWDAAHPRRH